jgi:O-antigen ligase
LRMAKDHPLSGVGFRHFRTRFDEYRIGNEEDYGYEFEIPDNMYLSLLSETGMMGLSVFIVFIFYLFKNGFAALRGKRLGLKEKEFLLLCMSGVAALLVNMAAYDMFYWYNPFALFCVLCGAIAAFSSLRQAGDIVCTG